MQIDELVVSLVLDAAGFTQGQKAASTAAQKGAADVAAAAEKGEKAQTGAFEAIVAGLNRLAAATEKGNERGVQAQKKVIESNKKVGESFEGAIRTGLTFLAVLAGARTVEDFTRKITALDAAIGRAAYGMGQSPQALSALGKAVERMGGDFNGAVAGMRALSDAYQDFRTTGSSALTEPLTRLQALSGKAVSFGKDTLANFTSIADALQALDQKGEHALADRLGRQILGSEDLTNLAKRGGPAVRAEMAESARHGVVDPKDVKAAQDLQTAYVGLSQSVVGLGTKIETALSPYLTKLLAQLDALIEKHGNEWVAEFGAFLEKHKPDIEAFGTALGDLIKNVNGIAASFSTGSPAFLALEAFAVLAGVRVVGALTGLTFAMRMLGGIALPSWFAKMLGLTGVAVAGADLMTNLDKRTTAAGPKESTGEWVARAADPAIGDMMYGRRDINGDREEGTEAGKKDAPTGFAGVWAKIKSVMGIGGDDPKIKDGIADTAKATKELRDLVRNGASLTAPIMGVTVSTGGTGGSGHHSDGTASPGAALRDRSADHRTFWQRHAPKALGGKDAPQRSGPSGVPYAAQGATEGMGITQKEWDAFREGVTDIEGKRYDRMGGAGGRYAGRYQMGPAEITDTAHRLGVARPSNAQFLGDPAMQERYFENYTMDHYRTLMTNPKFRAMSPRERLKILGYAHNQGTGGPTHGGGAWGYLEHGTVGHDAFGTGGTAYFGPIQRRLDEADRNVTSSASSTTARISDQDRLDAHNRIAAGKARTGDAALISEYQRQQNRPAPKAAETWHQSPLQATKGGGANALTDLYGAGFAKQPIKVDLTHDSAHRIGQATLGHVGREFLHAMHQAQRLTHHAKTPSGLHPAVHAAMHSPMMENHRALMAGARDAAYHRHSVIHNVDRRSTSQTKIGSIAVHTQATDAKGMVADLEPVFRRAADAGDFNYGLDG